MSYWESVLTLVGQIALIYLAYYYTQYYLRKSKSPPGPIPLPLLGNLIEVAAAHPIGHLAIHKLSKRYGSLYQLRIGMTDTVILASLSNCKAILNNDAAIGRDLSGLIRDRSLGQNIGFAFATGEQWNLMRPWAMKNLKNFGLRSKSSIESYTNEAIADIVESIDEVIDNDGVFDTNLAFNVAAVNIIWRAMTGRKILKDDEKMQTLMEVQDACIKSSAAGMAVIGTYPPLRHVIPGLLGYNVAMKFFTGFVETAKELLHEEFTKIGTDISSMEPSNLLEAYIHEMHVEKDNPRTIFTEDNFAVMFMDLFQGGSETTGAFIEWIVLLLALNPDEQRKLQAEIDSVLLNMECCSLSHKPKMIYTQAVLLESHRHTHVLPNGVPRRVTADIEHEGVIIRKGSNILVDFHTINNDTNVWGSDVDKFRPDRFISAEGKLANADKFIPFSYGRRNCPGESLSDTFSFLMVVNLFQRFTFSTLPGAQLPTTEPLNGFSCRPHPYKVLANRRNA